MFDMFKKSTILNNSEWKYSRYYDINPSVKWADRYLLKIVFDFVLLERVIRMHHILLIGVGNLECATIDCIACTNFLPLLATHAKECITSFTQGYEERLAYSSTFPICSPNLEDS